MEIKILFKGVVNFNNLKAIIVGEKGNYKEMAYEITYLTDKFECLEISQNELNKIKKKGNAEVELIQLINDPNYNFVLKINNKYEFFGIIDTEGETVDDIIKLLTK